MIKILCGENIVESRKALNIAVQKVRDNGTDVTVFGGNKLSLGEVKNALQSDSLLGGNRLVVIEGLLSGLKSTEKTKITVYLKEGKFDNDLVLWEGKEIKAVGLFPKAEILVFKINQVLFRFLESLKPGNTREMLGLLEDLKKQEEPEMIFYMLIRQFHFLIMAKDECLESLFPWQQQKFMAQAKHFSAEQLAKIYAELEEIDLKQKTSGDPYSLLSRLDLLIASL